MFKPVAIAKYAVNTIVSAVATNVASDLITKNTSLEEDAIVVRVSSGVIGWQVGQQTEVYTDAAVEKIAAWIAAKRDKNNPE